MTRLTPAQRTALRGLVAPVTLACVWSEDFCVSRSPHETWFLYCPREYRPPEYWALEPEEARAMVDGGLVELADEYAFGAGDSRTVRTYAITDAGRAALGGNQKSLRRRAEVSNDRENRTSDAGRSVSRGADRLAAFAAAGQGTLPDLDPV